MGRRIPIPVDPKALLAAGPAWLTSAFRAYGVISQDNAVVRIVHAEPFHAGNSGDKLVLSVDYALPDPGLHTDLFVKFSRCLHDPFRDRRKGELEAEVHLADLSRHPHFPVAVPRAYFARFDAGSGDGVLITQRIRFGEGGLEPLRPKNMDHLVANAPDYYRATATALARLAAAHKSGRLSPHVEHLFPFDPAQAAAELPLPWDAGQVRGKAQTIAQFIAGAPQLFPADATTPDFLARFVEDSMLFQQHDKAIRRFLFADPDMVALAHWNTHIDNAWFWRDEGGVLQAGLLDWGMARQMNLAMALWGGLSGGNRHLWDHHADGLIDHFLGELAGQGGPAIDPELFHLHLDLSVGMLTLALMLDMPAMFLSRMPDVAQARGPDNPLLHADKVVHGFLHTFGNAIALWQRRQFGASLARMLESSGAEG
ncbi:MAG: hypothetical protein AB7F98_08795 [Novosphingobium sp.]